MKRDEILNSPVYFYSTMQSPKGVRWTFRDVYIYLQSQSCAEYSKQAAQYIIENNGVVKKTEGYEYIKMKIAPAVVFGECRDGLRKLENMTNMGLMVIEVDKIPSFDVEAVKDVLYELPYIAYCQTSLSGHGVWALAAVDPTKDFDTMFVNIINEANKYLLCSALEGKIARYKIDDNASKINRMRVLSFDPARKPIKEEVEVFDDDRIIKAKTSSLEERLATKNFVSRKRYEENDERKYRIEYRGTYPHIGNEERMHLYTYLYHLSCSANCIDFIPDVLYEDYINSMPTRDGHSTDYYIKEFRKCRERWANSQKENKSVFWNVGFYKKYINENQINK